MPPEGQAVASVASPFVQLHLSEIDRIGKIVEELKIAAGHDAGGGAKPVDRGLWDRQVKETFAHAGFHVDVDWYTTNVPDVLVPEISIISRLSREEWDPEKMVHEVISDEAGLAGGTGTIKTDGSAGG